MKNRILYTILIIVLLLAVFCSCAKVATDTPLVADRRLAPGDICFSEHAADYINLFREDYPDMIITKLRWQVLPDGQETYVVEGNNGKTKSIVKYLMKNDMVLGRVERGFLEEELEQNSCIEKGLDLPNLLTHTELRDIAQQHLKGRIQELRIEWKDDTPIAYAEAIDEKTHRIEGITLCALTGDVLVQGGRHLVLDKDSQIPRQVSVRDLPKPAVESPSPSDEGGDGSDPDIDGESPEVSESPIAPPESIPPTDSPDPENPSESAPPTDSSEPENPSESTPPTDSSEPEIPTESTSPTDSFEPENPPEVAETEIIVQEGQTLVLGPGGAYLLRSNDGAMEDIPEAEWDTPTGYYDAQTQLSLEGDRVYLRSLQKSAIGAIKGTNTTLVVLDNSQIEIDTSQEIGVDVNNLQLGSLTSAQPVGLSVKAARIGVKFTYLFTTGPNTTVNTKASTHGIFSNVPRDEAGLGDMQFAEGSSLTAEVSANDGVAIKAGNIVAYATSIKAKAANGIGGLYVAHSMELYSENGVPSLLDTNSARGRATSARYINLYGSSLRGVALNGEMGVHANDYINADYDEDYNLPANIYGEANIGYGIVTQSIDNGNQEFPSGGIQIDGGNIEGRVNEGMGISTNTIYAYNDMGEKITVFGQAEKGIGISLCMLSSYGNNVTTTGISNGATDKHFQVYGDAIPDSCGFNSLSYVTLQGGAQLTGRAPSNIPGSYGIHCLLPYEGGGASGYLGIYSDGVDGPSVHATGHTGIYAVNMTLNGSVKMVAEGAKDGIKTSTFYTDAAAETETGSIVATGGSGIGLFIAKEWEGLYPEFRLSGADLVAKGGEYGIHAELQMDTTFYDSSIVAEATGSSPGAGMLLTTNLDLEERVTNIYIEGCSIEAKGGTGLWFHDCEVDVNAGETFKINKTPHIKGTGSETGIKLTYSEMFAPKYGPEKTPALVLRGQTLSDGREYVIWGQSDVLPPDEIGLDAAISTPYLLAEGNAIREEYTAIAKGGLHQSHPYAVYAKEMNVADYQRFDWKSSIEPLLASSDGLAPESSASGFDVPITGTAITSLQTDRIYLEGGHYDILLAADINIAEVVFNPMGGNPAPETQRIPIGGVVKEPTDVVLPGYHLDHWQIAGTNEAWNFSTPVTKDSLTLEAVWKPELYKLTYDANAGNETVTGLPKETEVQVGTLIENPQQSPVRNGYAFLYWAKDAAGKEKWEFDKMEMPASNLKLFAIWKINDSSVNYDGAGGTPELQSEKVPVGQPIPQNIIEPIRPGFKFIGWFEDIAATIPWKVPAAMPDKDITVHAGWERIKVYVRFDLNGGDAASKPDDIELGLGDEANITEFQPGNVAAPSYEGHYFVGWLKEDGTPAQNTFLMGEHDTVLVAQWQKAVLPDMPEYLVAYRDTQTRQQIEAQLQQEAHYIDLLGVEHVLTQKFEWDDAVLQSGGVGTIKVNFVENTNKPAMPSISVKIYILNYANLTAQQTQIFQIGDSITHKGLEWGPQCYQELPDFENQSIKRVPIDITFLLNGTDVREPGTYNPKFTAFYTDYFGDVHTLEYSVTAIVLPKGDALLQYWEVVAQTMSDPGDANHMFVSSKNYQVGGEAIGQKLEYFNRRVVARPGEFTQMTANALLATKNRDNAQLQVDLGWLQWYFNSQDFAASESAIYGTYPLDVEQNGSDALKALVETRNSMFLQFAMNKPWGGSPTMEVLVNDTLQKSAAEGKTLYLFLYNSFSDRLELIGKMQNNGDGLFSIRMRGVYGEYVILDELPAEPGKRPDFIITDNTNHIDDELEEIIENEILPLSPGDITTGTPDSEELDDMDFPMLNPSTNPLVGTITCCCILIILLLLCIAALVWLNIRQRRAYKRLAKELQKDGAITPETDMPENEDTKIN